MPADSGIKSNPLALSDLSDLGAALTDIVYLILCYG